MSHLRIHRSATSWFIGLTIFCSSTGCGQSPLVPFVRAIDQAASWAAAIRYAHDLESRRAVPGAYLKQIVKDGAADIDTVRQTIEKIADLPANFKGEGITLCEQLLAVLKSASSDPRMLEVARLKQVEDTLRSLIRTAGGQ
jgi:hypothetical protein